MKDADESPEKLHAPSREQASKPPVERDPLRTYLALLEVALGSSDAALRHDALIDAETHLRDAVAGGLSIERAIAEYGSPEEVASAYLSTAGTAARETDRWPSNGAVTEGATASVGPVPAGVVAESAVVPPARKRRLRDIPVLGIWFHPIAWRALVYFGVVSFPLATAYFVWSITIGSIAIGTVPTIIGLPLIVFLLGSARALSLFEGKVVEFFLGVRMPRRTQPVVGVVEDGIIAVGFWRRIWCWLRDVRSWLSLGYLLGNFPISLATFVVTFTLALMSFVLLALPIINLLGFPIGHVVDWEDGRMQFFFHEIKPDADGNLWLPSGAAIPTLLIGLALLTATLWLVRGMGWVYGHVVQAIQVARPRPTTTPR
ncbi:MAG: sensor domain-containing protein [bacterium]